MILLLKTLYTEGSEISRLANCSEDITVGGHQSRGSNAEQAGTGVQLMELLLIQSTEIGY